MRARRNICFVTGTRAEFGLMRTTLRAIDAHPKLKLQVIATGMHLDARLGSSIDDIRKQWPIDQTVPWPPGDGGATATAVAMGSAVSGIAAALEELRSDIVLVVGDRVEAFAAAAAGHVSQRIVAHVHGGDRAEGQIDDSLRHAITKLAHLHFPATAGSAARLRKLGEDRWRIHRVGAPGIDGLRAAAAPRAALAREFPQLRPHRFAMLVLHPIDRDDAVERRRAYKIADAIFQAKFEGLVVVAPNNDPGSAGIRSVWDEISTFDGVVYHPNLPRGTFLGLLRDAAVLVGNSSSGIIEAATFGTPVINVGPRQRGRERSGNVSDVSYARVGAAVRRAWDYGYPRRWKGTNVYGGSGAGRRIADILGRVQLSEALRKKLIAY